MHGRTMRSTRPAEVAGNLLATSRARSRGGVGVATLHHALVVAVRAVGGPAHSTGVHGRSRRSPRGTHAAGGSDSRACPSSGPREANNSSRATAAGRAAFSTFAAAHNAAFTGMATAMRHSGMDGLAGTRSGCPLLEMEVRPLDADLLHGPGKAAPGRTGGDAGGTTSSAAGGVALDGALGRSSRGARDLGRLRRQAFEHHQAKRMREVERDIRAVTQHLSHIRDQMRVVLGLPVRSPRHAGRPSDRHRVPAANAEYQLSHLSKQVAYHSTALTAQHFQLAPEMNLLRLLHLSVSIFQLSPSASSLMYLLRSTIAATLHHRAAYRLVEPTPATSAALEAPSVRDPLGALHRVIEAAIIVPHAMHEAISLPLNLTGPQFGAGVDERGGNGSRLSEVQDALHGDLQALAAADAGLAWLFSSPAATANVVATFAAELRRADVADLSEAGAAASPTHSSSSALLNFSFRRVVAWSRFCRSVRRELDAATRIEEDSHAAPMRRRVEHSLRGLNGLGPSRVVKAVHISMLTLAPGTTPGTHAGRSWISPHHNTAPSSASAGLVVSPGLGKEFLQEVLRSFLSESAPREDTKSDPMAASSWTLEVTLTSSHIAVLCTAIVFFKLATEEALHFLLAALQPLELGCGTGSLHGYTSLSGFQLSNVVLAYAMVGYRSPTFFMTLGEEAGRRGEQLHEDDVGRILHALEMAGIEHETLRSSLESSMRMKHLSRRPIADRAW